MIVDGVYTGKYIGRPMQGFKKGKYTIRITKLDNVYAIEDLLDDGYMRLSSEKSIKNYFENLKYSTGEE